MARTSGYDGGKKNRRPEKKPAAAVIANATASKTAPTKEAATAAKPGNGNTGKTSVPPKPTSTKESSAQTAAPIAKAASPHAKIPVISADERQRMIREAAYYIAERRGFQGGDPAQDWRQAEAEIDRLIGGSRTP